MAQTPQEPMKGYSSSERNGRDRIVISGMSGTYPECNNVKEFEDLLYNKVNPIVHGNPRWKYNHPEVAQFTGNIPNLDRFDAQFFAVHSRLGNHLDAMSRKMLEHTYQALYDAGVSPEHLSGTNVGVFVGACISESEKVSSYETSTNSGFGIVGSSKAMFANRISFWLNAKGPSVVIDMACCSSITALEQAYQAIARGECEAAVVGASNLSIHPHSTLHYSRIIKTTRRKNILTILPERMCSTDGNTKSFDNNSDGCVKSEAINILFLQKAKHALRSYADVLHVKSVYLSLDGETEPQFGFYRDPVIARNFMKTFYDESGVSPKEVEYVEAFGSATPGADRSELQAISDVFCGDRKAPLLVGSVMSNIGYSEAASGTSSITKVLLGYRQGEIAANLNCQTPRKDVPALQDGRIRIVTDHQPFRRTYTAVNNISITGCNAHVLLHGRFKPKDHTRYKSNIPRLVTISGRQESAVRKIIDDLKSRPIDPEELALLHNIHSVSITGHMGRGFTVLDSNTEHKTVSLMEKCEYFDDARRPLWFVYSGMGSQWPEMGTQLMHIPIFKGAIDKCQQILLQKGIDLVHIITSSDRNMFNNVLNSFVGIAAIQIGLTDVLKNLGLVPDKIIGHSVGELGCAYADGCFTAEEMILAAYSRGLVSTQTPLIRGSMAAVGLGYDQIVNMIPPEIEVACHNSSESCTISGPSEKLKEFVVKLSSKGIFAKEVPCSNIAYHSRYIADAGPGLLKYLTEVIKNPKPRSQKWLSTSIPQDRWDEPIAKFSSAEYHTNNLLNPVLFEEISRLIPPNAVLVEIAPHGLLQAILKRSLPPTCSNIPLTRRGHPNNHLLLLEAVGKLFMEGYNPKVSALYPQVEYPVSTETPLLSHLVEWNHTEKWNLPLFLAARNRTAAASNFIISIHDQEHSYLRGNIVRGKNTYPYAASLVAAWDTVAMSIGVQKKKISVEFRDIHLFAQPVLQDQRQLTLSVKIHRGSGHFEIMDENSKVASGFIVAKTHPLKKISSGMGESSDVVFNSSDVYRMFYDREYSYTGDFQSIHCANMTLTEAYLHWKQNWVTLIDGMLQLNTLKQKHDSVSQPAYIRRLSVDIKEHFYADLFDIDGKRLLKANVLEQLDHTRCGGILIENIRFHDLPILNSEKLLINSLQIVPRIQSDKTNDVKTTLEVYLQIVAESLNKDFIQVVQVMETQTQCYKITDVNADILKAVAGIKVNFKRVLTVTNLSGEAHLLTNADLVLVSNISKDERMFKFLHNILKQDVFVVSVEDNNTFIRTRPQVIYRVVSSHKTGKVTLNLGKWRPTPLPSFTTTLTVRSIKDLALLCSTRDNLPKDHKLVVLTSYPPIDGVKDLVAKWRKDSERKHVFLLMINYKNTEDKSLDQLPDLDLPFNIIDQNSWGGEYYLPLTEKQQQSSVGNVTLQIKEIGDLDTLRWVEIPEPRGPGFFVDVHYAGLNTLDAKRATGEFPMNNYIENSFGIDYSGITSSGVRVMGLVANGACSKKIKAIPELMWPVPRHWSMEEAASVPLPYAHAFYCLAIKTQLVANRSILVHGGAGALGQAAIAISLAHGLRVFATVSDTRKKHFLRKLFPGLKEEQIGNSRDNSFGDMVLGLTKGAGVDYVINCVKGELKNTSLKACGAFAVILDTQIKDNFLFGMEHLSNEKNYIAVDFSSIFTERNSTDMRKLQLLLSSGISQGYVRPLSLVTYGVDDADVARAIRLLEASRHRGRALLRLFGTLPNMHPRLTCKPSHCHLIICDDPIDGMQLADRLVARGAKKLHLHLPKAHPQILLKKQIWVNNGVDLKISTNDLSGSNNVLSLINDSINMGPVEGIYYVNTSASNARINQAVLTALDAVTRKNCPSLKYFAVVSIDNIFGNYTVISRAQDGLCGTKLLISEIRRMDGKPAEATISWRNMLDALDSALHNGNPINHASTKLGSRKTLWQNIEDISGKRIPKNANDETTLEEIGVSQQKQLAISHCLRNEYNTVLDDDDILWLNMQQIKKIDQNRNGNKYEEVNGLGVFFSHIDADELMSTTEMVFLPSLTSATVKGDEFDVSQAYLCIVPGMEGNHERFRELCQRIKIPTVVLQSGLDFPNESIMQMAHRHSEIILRRANLKNNFYLAGYESGVLVAIEMAKILEKQGLSGTIYCIGALPEQFKTMVQKELREYRTDDELQKAVICHMFSLMKHEPCELKLEGLTWQEKVNSSARALKGQVALSTQYVRALFDCAYGRLVQARRYETHPQQLLSKIVLLRTADNTSRPITVAELQQYSRQPIRVHNLQLPLAHALKDLRCAAIINQHLHPDILQEFDEKNLCETYLLKAESFMTSGANQEDKE